MQKLSLAKTETAVIEENFKYWLSQASKEQFQGGLTWYERTGLECQAISDNYEGISKLQVAKVVSVLSPQKKWEDNILEANGCIKTFVTSGPVEKPTYTSKSGKIKNVFATVKQVQKVWDILSTDTDEGFGNKTHSFAMNIAYAPNSDHITNDFWMSRAALTQDVTIEKKSLPQGPTGKQYNRMTEILNKIAAENGIKGYQLQAIIWVTIRTKWAEQGSK